MTASLDWIVLITGAIASLAFFSSIALLFFGFKWAWLLLLAAIVTAWRVRPYVDAYVLKNGSEGS